MNENSQSRPITPQTEIITFMLAYAFRRRQVTNTANFIDAIVVGLVARPPFAAFVITTLHARRFP